MTPKHRDRLARILADVTALADDLRDARDDADPCSAEKAAFRNAQRNVEDAETALMKAQAYDERNAS